MDIWTYAPYYMHSFVQEGESPPRCLDVCEIPDYVLAFKDAINAECQEIISGRAMRRDAERYALILRITPAGYTLKMVPHASAALSYLSDQEFDALEAYREAIMADPRYKVVKDGDRIYAYNASEVRAAERGAR